MDSRERVKRTLEFDSPDRVPRQMWVLPWAEDRFPGRVREIQKSFPDDIVSPPVFFEKEPPGKGDRHLPGESVDDWGCTFHNIQKGAIGEVKEPQLVDWRDVDRVRIPEERLTVDAEKINEFCRSTDRYVLAAGCFPRPFEQLQFIRGTENLLLDLMDQPPEFFALLDRMHDFYKRELDLWAGTEVDALFIMDDWGSQDSLLISPDLWRRLFKPLYRDYIDIAHANGKHIFMHSDGHILEIMEDLVELGLDAVNSQVFCMGLESLSERFSGRITFWGELDRQRLIPSGTRSEIKDAARQMKEAFHRGGGLIAQCEFGLGANPDNIHTFFEAW